jgi:hypothetical protein
MNEHVKKSASLMDCGSVGLLTHGPGVVFLGAFAYTRLTASSSGTEEAISSMECPSAIPWDAGDFKLQEADRPSSHGSARYQRTERAAKGGSSTYGRHKR